MAKSKETATVTKKDVQKREPKTKKQEELVEITTSQIKIENRLKLKYKTQIIPQLVKTYKYSSVMQVPKLEKVVLNMRLGDIKDNGKSVQSAVKELELIAGQKPVLTKAKHSVANFKVRQNQDIGAKVTLRAERMWDFFDKLISIALPRVRDFRGVSPKSFDGRGNYSLGIKEQLIFPEIAYDQVEKVRGFDICFVTTAKTDAEAKELLTLLGMPFAR
jgi:large subunit ribosomal protein L5